MVERETERKGVQPKRYRFESKLRGRHSLVANGGLIDTKDDAESHAARVMRWPLRDYLSCHYCFRGLKSISKGSGEYSRLSLRQLRHPTQLARSLDLLISHVVIDGRLSSSKPVYGKVSTEVS